MQSGIILWQLTETFIHLNQPWCKSRSVLSRLDGEEDGEEEMWVMGELGEDEEQEDEDMGVVAESLWDPLLLSGGTGARWPSGTSRSCQEGTRTYAISAIHAIDTGSAIFVSLRWWNNSQKKHFYMPCGGWRPVPCAAGAAAGRRTCLPAPGWGPPRCSAAEGPVWTGERGGWESAESEDKRTD